jgi:hypothetical protein
VKFGIVRTRPDDDFMHPADDAHVFSESVYYNFGDRRQDLGGFFRIGNRVNEGYAEVSTCLFLPGGTVAFWYLKPPITDNDGHDAGGLRCETVEAHAVHTVHYDGEVVVLADPGQMEEPRAAFKGNPHEPCQVNLTFRSVADTFWPWVPAEDGPLEGFDAVLHEAFARNHLNQHMTATGSVTVGGDTYTVDDGLGWRDRSWGARSWSSIDMYRWTSVSFGPDLGLAVMVFGDEDGNTYPRGYVHHGRERPPSRIMEAEYRTTDDQNWYARAVEISVTDESGQRYDISGDVKGHIPLRFRRGEQLTRTTEALMRWRCGERTGVGILEYLDQIVDGRPSGTFREAPA